MSKPTDDAWAWLKAQIGDRAVMVLAFIFVVLLSGAWARAIVIDAADDRVQPVRRAVETVQKKQDRYEEDVHEFAKDVRELYRVSPVIRRSDRLERPFPEHDDGGEP